MNLISVKEAADKWKVSVRRVQKLCSDGRVKGAIKFGQVWMIPNTAVLPTQNKDSEPTIRVMNKTGIEDKNALIYIV